MSRLVNYYYHMINFTSCIAFGFQDPSTEYAKALIELHHKIFFWLILIFVFVAWLISNFIYEFNSDKVIDSRNFNSSITVFRYWPLRNSINLLIKEARVKKLLNYFKSENLIHNTNLEIIWTVIPTIILVLIGIPSFAIIYAYDEPDSNPYITLKIIGHQWYWSYEYSDYTSDTNIAFDSYMLDESELKPGQLRLLEVDNRVTLPVGTSIRFLVTSGDVLHSWSVPSMGIKVDAIPGRLNQVISLITRPGVFYGQCSELCGVNHGFMPIAVEAVSINQYLDWIKSYFQDGDVGSSSKIVKEATTVYSTNVANNSAVDKKLESSFNEMLYETDPEKLKNSTVDYKNMVLPTSISRFFLRLFYLAELYDQYMFENKDKLPKFPIGTTGEFKISEPSIEEILEWKEAKDNENSKQK